MRGRGHGRGRRLEVEGVVQRLQSERGGRGGGREKDPPRK